MSETTKPAESGKNPIKKKGTQATEVIIGSAALNIRKSLTALSDAVKTVESLGDKAEEMQGLIAQREDRIKELDVMFAETKRQKTVELDLKVKEDEQKVVNDVLAKNNLVAIPQAELDNIKANLTKATSEMNSEIQKAVGAATSSLKKDHESAVALTAAENKAKEAANTAMLATTESKLKFLEEQVEMWKSALDAERQAGVERAKASSVGSINVGNTGK